MSKQFNYLKSYLVNLDEFRKPPVHLVAAETFFNQKLYAWAIKELKDHMGIPYKIKVSVDRGLENPGRFILPIPFPRGRLLDSYIFAFFINPEVLVDFNQFVAVMSHELSHLLLFSYNNGHGHVCSPHCLIGATIEIEKATDITAIIIGFGHYIKEARKRDFVNEEGALLTRTLGYLSDQEFEFIYDCFINNRKFRKVPKKKRRTFIQKIVEIFKNTFT